MTLLTSAYGNIPAFYIGPPDNLFGTTSGNVLSSPSTVTPAADKVTAEAVRDAYGTANASWLAKYDNNGLLNIRVIFYDASNTIIVHQVRQGGEWVDNGMVIAVQGLPGSGTDFSAISENHIPAIGPGPGKIPFDSGFRVDPVTKRLIADEGIEIPPAELLLGESTSLSSSFKVLHMRSLAASIKGFIPLQLYDTVSGFSRLYALEGDTIENVIFNDPAGTDNSDTAVFDITTTANEVITKISVETTNISQAITITIIGRTGSQTGPIAMNFNSSVTTDGTGLAVIDLSENLNPIVVDNATQLFFNVSCINMIGKQIDVDTFIPNVTVQRIVLTQQQIAYYDEIFTEINRIDSFLNSAIARGGGYFATPVATVCTVAGTFYKVDAAFIPWPDLLNFEWDSVNKRFNFTGTSDATFAASASWSCNANGVGTVTYSLFINGASSGLERPKSLQSPSETASLSGEGIVPASLGDYFELYVACSNAGTTVYTKDCQFVLGS